ncbi:MAG: FAD-dependent oxidoreductase, partial [Pseudomonadota bacterium]
TQALSISPGQAGEYWPMMQADDVLGAVWSPDDGRISPSDVCAALSRAARKLGARIFEQTAVTGILTANGRIKGVETNRGTVMCDAIALCAGLWSREVAQMAGADAPLLACEHFYLLTRPLEGMQGNLPTLSDHDHHLYIRDDSGGLLIGCFEPMGKAIAPGMLDERFAFSLLPEDWDHFQPMMEHALHRIPALHDAEVKMLLNGPESFTPDGMFMLGEAAETRGLFFGCGMNSVGIAAGGGAGMNLAHAIIHGACAYDLGEACAKRFHPIFNRIEHLMARIPEVLGAHYDIAYPGASWRSARNLRMMPLHELHLQSGAYMGQVYGFERPLYFGSKSPPHLRFDRLDWFANVGEEVEVAHCGAALFDGSSFGKIDVEGPDAEQFLCRSCAGHVDRPSGSVIYTAMLNEGGGFESDLIAQRLSSVQYRLFVPTALIRHNLAWLERTRQDFDVVIRDVSEAYALIGLMGPKAAHIARIIGADFMLQVKRFNHAQGQIAGKAIRAARISYVGEDGWEITCHHDDAAPIYSALLEAGAKPAGLFAQTSMRIENGFRAMGQELDSDITPVEAGLAAFTRKNGGFIGFEAMQHRLAMGAVPQILSLVFDDVQAVPLGHEPVLLDHAIVGMTTSCAFGYRAGKPVGLCQLTSSIDVPARVQVRIGDIYFDAKLSLAPPLEPGS